MPTSDERLDMAGMKFGRRTILSELPKRGYLRVWLCRCDCGRERAVYAGNLRSGKSTGCRKCSGRGPRTHGDTSGGIAPEYRAWAAMIARCENENHNRFHIYGARGIKVCDRWRTSYANFIADMGRRPTAKHSIDRVNVNGGYEPTNCRWATSTEQNRNRRSNRTVTFRGQTKCISEWAEVTGIGDGSIRFRLSNGWSVDRALTEPVQAVRR